MEQVASQCRGGFLRQLLQETTGRLEQGCGTISDAYIHYYYKLQFQSVTDRRTDLLTQCYNHDLEEIFMVNTDKF